MQKAEVVPTGGRSFRVDTRDPSEVDQDRLLPGSRADGFPISCHLGQLILGLQNLVFTLLHQVFARLDEHIEILFLELSFFNL